MNGPGSSGTLLAIGLQLACTPSAMSRPIALAPPPEVGAPAEAAEAFTRATPSCKDVGVLAWDIPPSPLQELCARSAPRLIGSDGSEQDPGPMGDFKCDPLEESLPAPGTSGLKSTAVMHIDAAVDADNTPLREETWYLVAETSRGYCLAAPLLAWDFERDWWWENSFRFSWSKQNGSAPELHAETQFVAMIDENGEVFPDHKYCERYRYRVSGGKFALLEKKEELERCFPEESEAEP